MALGPGKYDEIATIAREAAGALAVILIVLDGTHGSGFSVQAVGEDISTHLPALLRTVADGIEGDMAMTPERG
jgi:hypothetical protein